MSKTIHMCVSISGMLSESDSFLKGMMTDDRGEPLSGKAVREHLRYEQAMGKRVLPVGDPCEGFCYQNGCPGHENLEEPTK